MNKMKKYKGACHCGAVKFEVMAELEKVIECNCSYCSIKRILLSFVDKEDLKILEGEDQLSSYFFNTKGIDHQFCKNCGVQTFGIGISFPQAGINVSCLEDLNLENLNIIQYDGKDK